MGKKVKIKESELKAFIAEAVVRVLKEDFMEEDWMDDLIAQAEMDPNARAAAQQAMGDDEDIELDPEGEEQDIDDEDDEALRRQKYSTEINFEDLSDEELDQILSRDTAVKQPMDKRIAAAEKKEREKARQLDKEGLPLPYGFKKINGVVQRAHTGIGRKNDSAWNAATDHKTFAWGGGSTE